MALLSQLRTQIFAACALLAAAGCAAKADAANYDLDAKHANITFTYYVGFTSHTGHFSGLSGAFRLDEKNPGNNSSEAAVKTRTLTASMFEGELKSETWFNIDKFPELRFKSRFIKPAGVNKYEVVGDLTMHGVTHLVTLDTIKKGNHLSSHAQIKRGDFDMTAMSLLVADGIDIQIEADLIEKN